MELLGKSVVFFVIYGGLHYLFTERKRKDPTGLVQPRTRALLRTVGTAALATFLYMLFMEVLEVF
ncbi:MAG: hypothetical protein R6U25_11470 [Alkalispirochaeta sp.]